MRKILVLSGFLLLIGCNRVPLDQQLVSHDTQIREKGFKNLSSLSTKQQRQLATDLIVYIRNEDGRISNRATKALVAIGEPAVELLSSLLKDSDVYVRLNAAAALGEIGSSAKFAVPALLESVKDPHPLVREESLHSLGSIETDGAALGEQILTIAQTDQNEDVRIMAEKTLKKFGIAYKPSKKKLS